MAKLPSFAQLATHYLTQSADQVKEEVGGEVNADWITNTCTIRMSRSFNYCGKTAAKIPEIQGLFTVKGADGKNYALRVEEFNHFLRDKYGTPSVIRSGKDISIQPFHGKRGIINWHVSGWADATGHFTLWDQNRGLYEGEEVYFEMPIKHPDGGGPWLTKVELWEC
ncbi:MAG: hypothetical protein QOH65_2833 [Methylobacteriaceae bacterium]|jgi:hypothetical protein|nr:hypothetical protein [Methylobacteriaceae bacterium]